MKKIINIAHRGFSGLYPENTLCAFIKAIEVGCDGLETDVHLTKDGILVLCHDETINKTTTGKGFIKDLTYNELQKFDAGIKFSESFKGEKIPTLESLMILAKKNNTFLNLELKNDIIHYEGLEEKIVQMIRDFDMKNLVLLSSFNHNSMKKVKNIDSEILTGLLFHKNYSFSLDEIEKYNCDAINPEYTDLLNISRFERIKKLNLKIYTYTVNEENIMNNLIKMKIDGIITNFPNALKSILDSQP